MKEQSFQNFSESERKRFATIEGRSDLFETKFLQIGSTARAAGQKEVLIATRDPGSANALVPVMKELMKDQGVHMDVVTDGRAQESIQKQFPTEDRTSAGLVLESVQTVGTPDVLLMDNSSEMGLDTFVDATFEEVPKVLVEDYPGASIRFLSALIERKLPLPEKICVMDSAAKDLILEEFPDLETRVVVTGQPSFDRFASEDAEQVAQDVRGRLGLTDSDKLVSYMSTMDEPEKIVLMAQTLKDMAGSFTFVFRRHPRDNTSYETYKKILVDAGIHVLDTDGFTTDEIGAASDVVLTTWSTAGLDGIYRRKPTVHLVDSRFRIEENLRLPLPPVKVGASVGVERVEGLARVLPSLLDPESELNTTLQQGMEKEYPADGKNAQRVADVVRDYLETT